MSTISRTRIWVERVVIGLNLCPFARRPLNEGRVVFRVCEASDRAAIYRGVLRHLGDFLAADPRQQETALIIVPQGLDRFEDYLDMLQLLDESLDDSRLRDWVQLASFHPAYRFDGAPEDDPANYTNRSPYPMFHVIREEALTQALATYIEPDDIPRRNVHRLRQLGLGGILELLNDVTNTDQ